MKPAAAEESELLRDLGPSLTNAFGDVGAPAVDRLRGDASTRIYYRLTLRAPTAPTTALVMRLPADALRSDEGTGADIPPELPFLNMQRALAVRGVPVPRVLAHDVPRRVVLLEDLGDETFEARLRERGVAAWPELYGHAVDLLADMHDRMASAEPGCIAYTRRFDEALLRWELEHFVEWGIDALRFPLTDAARATLASNFDALARELAEAPPHFVHRDYQSRNLMWTGDRLTVIDFQDALLGPMPYDLVALLCDSYVALAPELQRSLIARYVERRGGHVDRAAFERLFWKVAVQRKLKDTGRFVFIDRVRGNPSFLPSFAPSLRYVARALAELPELRAVDGILREVLPGYPDAVRTPDPMSRAGE
ncbi:MAG: phosphotransferase [Polyangiales bacterium]